uniref:Uncharacterized protein n=1 Tax=Felis catus TaxID=9685 RepID=A0ABI7VW22_FELCA
MLGSAWGFSVSLCVPPLLALSQKKKILKKKNNFTNKLKNKWPMPMNIWASINRRLAQQMENRPSAQAALKLKQRGKTLNQHLDKSNIQAWLGRHIGALARGGIGEQSLPIIQRGVPRGGLCGGLATEPCLVGGWGMSL